MHPTVKYLSSACAGALLIACADIGPRGAPPAPPARLSGSPDEAYLLGRQQHMENRYATAIASYQDALRRDPRHVNATNGLATLYAEQGELAQAIALWRRLTDAPAAPSGPGAAFLFSNLGYAHLLNGEFEPAVAALERACVLDPLNYRAWRHLGSALEKLGQVERAALMFKQASALEQHDFKADYALVQRSGGAGNVAVPAAVPSADGWAATEVRQTGSGMFELRRNGAGVPAAVAAPAPAPQEQEQPRPDAAPVPAATAAVDAPVTRLEIRNGNGVPGMARSLARAMGEPGMRVVRLSNEKGFNVAHTRIEYPAGLREVANRLAERFGNATVLEVAGRNNADMRLVIGRDLARSKSDARRIIKAALARAGRVA